MRHAIEGARRRARCATSASLVSAASRGTWCRRSTRMTRRWLMRSRSPYLAEIAAIAAALEFPGVWFLNGSYEWGCTALARDDGAPWLVRTLDWPFPGLGRHVEVARMAGPAGEFYSVTWPGFVGVLTAMAPGRFAASVNQAPLWRRTRHPWLRPYDMAANAVDDLVAAAHPAGPAAARRCSRPAPTFGARGALLETTPIARPVIYTLAGCEAGERCVIERTEGRLHHAHRGHRRGERLARAAHGRGRRASAATSCSPAAIARRAPTAETGARRSPRGTRRSAGSFAWVVPPVLNRFTRIAVEMCAAQGHPARGRLRDSGRRRTAAARRRRCARCARRRRKPRARIGVLSQPRSAAS